MRMGRSEWKKKFEEQVAFIRGLQDGVNKSLERGKAMKDELEEAKIELRNTNAKLLRINFYLESWHQQIHSLLTPEKEEG
jgi:hypothetical protein